MDDGSNRPDSSEKAAKKRPRKVSADRRGDRAVKENSGLEQERKLHKGILGNNLCKDKDRSHDLLFCKRDKEIRILQAKSEALGGLFES